MVHTRIALLLSLLLLLTAAGCGVTSRHPLSDEESSTADERLLGRWQPVEEDPAEPPDQFWVGLVKDRKNTMEVVGLELDDEKHVQVRRFRLYAVKLGGKRFLSVTGEDGLRFLLLRYVLPDGETLHVFPLKEEVVAQAIEAKELAGWVKKKKTEGDLEIDYEEIVINAPIEDLRAWVGEHADTCFDLEDPAVFRRVESP